MPAAVPSRPCASSATQHPPGSWRTRCSIRVRHEADLAADRRVGSGQPARCVRTSKSWKASSVSRSTSPTSASVIGRTKKSLGTGSIYARPLGKDGHMRVLIAPDKFAGTLTAVEAAEAIATGWRRRAPEDELDLAPMADGGPGFVDVLHASIGGDLLAAAVRGPYRDPVSASGLVPGTPPHPGSAPARVLHASIGGDLLAATVRGPYGDPVSASVLVRDTTAYVESAQACGLHLTPEDRREPERATSYGVGELLLAAVDAGATTMHVGLGGSGNKDRGAGTLGAPGGPPPPPDPP